MVVESPPSARATAKIDKSVPRSGWRSVLYAVALYFVLSFGAAVFLGVSFENELRASSGKVEHGLALLPLYERLYIARSAVAGLIAGYTLFSLHGRPIAVVTLILSLVCALMPVLGAPLAAAWSGLAAFVSVWIGSFLSFWRKVEADAARLGA